MVFSVHRALKHLAAVVGIHHILVHIGNQFGMQPRELPDDFEFLLRSFPQGPFTMTAIQKQSAESRKLCPANVKSWWNLLPGEACHVRTDDIITEVRARKDILYRLFDPIDPIHRQICILLVLFRYFPGRFPCMFLITDPIDRRSIDWGKPFGMRPAVNRTRHRYKFEILGKTMLIFIAVITVSYTHLRAHETRHDIVCRLLLE